MTVEISRFSSLSDAELSACLASLARAERRATAMLVASLGEFDRRKLYLGAGCSSLFTYCTNVLRLSEHAAYGRIEAARVSRRVPQVLDHLSEGALTLTTVCLLAPLLTPENATDLLASARHKSKRDVEVLVASLRPAAPVGATIRKLPTRPTDAAMSPGLHDSATECSSSAVGQLLETPAQPAAQSGQLHPHTTPPSDLFPLVPEVRRTSRAELHPVTIDRYKLQATISRETHDLLRRAQDLLRHGLPDGDLAVILNRALALLVEDLERRKCAATGKPRPTREVTKPSRHLPASVKRAVWSRDEGQCAFVGTLGRCAERGFLEFHHIVPYARGGPASAENIQLRCRAHNAYEAEREFGLTAVPR